MFERSTAPRHVQKGHLAAATQGCEAAHSELPQLKQQMPDHDMGNHNFTATRECKSKRKLLKQSDMSQSSSARQHILATY
eukprot:6482644-Amphidinium_carterae.1